MIHTSIRAGFVAEYDFSASRAPLRENLVGSPAIGGWRVGRVLSVDRAVGDEATAATGG
jgi:hypothetical protein